MVTIPGPLYSLDALISAVETAALIVAFGPREVVVHVDKDPLAHSIPSVAVLSGFCRHWGLATRVVFAQGLWEVRCCCPAKEKPSPADSSCPQLAAFRGLLLQV